MALKSLEQYIKSETPQKIDVVTRSVCIDKRHREFLENNRMNLSAMVRDMLDSAIAMAKKKRRHSYYCDKEESIPAAGDRTKRVGA